MKENLWQKRLPNLLVFLFLILALGITALLTGNTAIFLTRASPTNTPQNVKITNISDTSFTLSYTTADKVSGVLSFGSDKKTWETVEDEKDVKAKTIGSYNTHYMVVKNLKSQNLYYFSIISGSDTFQNNGTYYEITTASSSIEKPSVSSSKISGSVILADGSKPKEGILYLSSEKSQILSTAINSDGIYSLDLSSLRSKDLKSYFSFSQNDLLLLTITSGSLESNINLTYGQTTSMPVITLSQNYDFTINNSSPLINTASTSAQFPNLEPSETSNNNPQIISPLKDQEFIDQKPLFKGTASPGANVNIIIQSDQQIKTKVTADQNGVWTYRPQTPLSPGEHTIAILTNDNSGILKKVTQSFTVYASGTQVNQSATPSATIVPSITPAPTMIPPTFTPTPTPTFIPTPTPTIFIISPTLIPQPVIEAPGSSSLTTGITALAATAFGIITFILTKGF